ncbi:MAG: DegT/DnrJ/EryC1/StrS family aminotransferase [Bryobacterales bacterium]|nr:DegT/DnrJ/EryC1/StrS family aminotransferase [Bryobacterales bacterium]
MSLISPIPLSNPDIGHLEKAAVLRVLGSGRLSLGPLLPAFESAIAERTGVVHAIAVNSGTSGLHLCIKAAGIAEGDEVITSPFSFIASANCILFEGGIPRFVDIDPVTFNLDTDRIEDAITPRTKAILPVHVFGRPCDMAAVLRIADRYHLKVIEDACEAIGARLQGRAAGSFGQTGVFAFYPNKQITTGEGGVIVTNDSRAAALCRSWRNQGRCDGDAWLSHARLGYNYRLSDIQCALGLAQLSRLDTFLALRAHVAARYTEFLQAEVPEVLPPAPPAAGSEMSWFVYVVRLHDEFTQQHRDCIVNDLRAAHIGTNIYFTPIHLQPFFRRQFGYRPNDFPITERISARTIALPFFNRLTDRQIAFVVHALRKAIGRLKPRSLSLGARATYCASAASSVAVSARL